MSQISDEMNVFLQDEKVLWKGCPDTSVHFTSVDLFYVPLNIIFMWFVLKDFVIDGFDVFGIPFILAGLYDLVGRFFLKQFRKGRTVYYVTDKRIIILDKSKNKILQEQDIKLIRHINKNVRRSGIGTVEFGNQTIIQLLGGNTGMDILEKTNFYETGEKRVPIFYDIENAEDVYMLVNKLKA